jgi:hypothetical protein
LGTVPVMTAHRSIGVLVGLVLLLPACSSDDSSDSTTPPASGTSDATTPSSQPDGTVVLQDADSAREAERRAVAVRGTVGEPVEAFDMVWLVRSITPAGTYDDGIGGGGPQYDVDVRVENPTRDDEPFPQFQIVCIDGTEGGYLADSTFDQFDSYPPASFREGILKTYAPEPCEAPVLRAALTGVSFGDELIDWPLPGTDLGPPPTPATTIDVTIDPADDALETTDVDEILDALADAGLECANVVDEPLSGIDGEPLPIEGRSVACTASNGARLGVAAFDDQANRDAAILYVATIISGFMPDAVLLAAVGDYGFVTTENYTPDDEPIVRQIADALGWDVENLIELGD